MRAEGRQWPWKGLATQQGPSCPPPPALCLFESAWVVQRWGRGSPWVGPPLWGPCISPVRQGSQHEPANQYACHEDRLGQLLQFFGVAYQVPLHVRERGPGSSVQPTQPGPRVCTPSPSALAWVPLAYPLRPGPGLLGSLPRGCERRTALQRVWPAIRLLVTLAVTHPGLFSSSAGSPESSGSLCVCSPASHTQGGSLCLHPLSSRGRSSSPHLRLSLPLQTPPHLHLHVLQSLHLRALFPSTFTPFLSSLQSQISGTRNHPCCYPSLCPTHFPSLSPLHH